jgi:hypothetical protein
MTYEETLPLPLIQDDWSVEEDTITIKYRIKREQSEDASFPREEWDTSDYERGHHHHPSQGNPRSCPYLISGTTAAVLTGLISR